jgi:hypothetical protein
LQSLEGDSGTVQGWEGGQLDPGCWEGNKEAHAIHFLTNSILFFFKLWWTSMEINQSEYCFEMMRWYSQNKSTW